MYVCKLHLKEEKQDVVEVFVGCRTNSLNSSGVLVSV